MVKAIIYKPANTVTQSGEAKDFWILRFLSDDKKYNEPMMGWVGSKDTKRQLDSLKFKTQEEAESYAKKSGITFFIKQPQLHKIRPKSYAENFK